MFFVNGWFLQEGARLNLDPRSGLPLIYDGSERFWYFHGCFTLLDEVNFEGSIEDMCGHASVTDGRLEINESIVKIVFTKMYTHRCDPITYALASRGLDGTFEGEYDGPLIGRGKARLFLTEPPQGFFKV